MKKQPNEGLRELRNILGQTQAEFAGMIGASKDAVVSWELGRNQLSAAFARRIALVTGADERALMIGLSVPISNAADAHVYTADDFKRHLQSEWGRTDEESLRRKMEYCQDTMELLLRAAVAQAETKRHCLPGVLEAFTQWCEGVRTDFGLGPAIDDQLKERRRKAGVTQCYRVWRRMAREDASAMAAAGFKDDPDKGDKDELRLVLDLVAGWAPGRSMKWPRPAIMKPARPVGVEKTQKLKR
jgi:transcriptional regulator with XRE-family HTH domain